MKVYVFGNPDSSIDNRPFKIAKQLGKDNQSIEFIIVKTNSDLPFTNGEDVVILDTVAGIQKVEILKNKDINRLSPGYRTTVHDFDLGFQLRYLQKLGKLGKITIIGIPQKGKFSYSRIQSILRKLVAQDMQGS